MTQSPTEKRDPFEFYEYVAGASNRSRAMADLRRGMQRWQLWYDMALRQFRNQYRGAVIGPFWISITMAMTATGLGVLYAQIFGIPLREHLPYVTVSLTLWNFISSFITAGTNVFNTSAHIFKEYPLPLSIFPFRMSVLQLLNFAFRMIPFVIIFLIFQVPLTPMAFLAIPGFLLLLWIGFWASLWLGVINAHFRDFGQFIGASLMFIFFMTPIFWRPEKLGEYAALMNFNPFYHFIEVIRTPLLGGPDLALHFAVTGGFAIFSTLLGIGLYGRFAHRLPYWC